MKKARLMVKKRTTRGYVNPNVNVISDDEGYDTDDTMPGGRKRKTNSTRKHKKRKLNKRKKNYSQT